MFSTTDPPDTAAFFQTTRWSVISRLQSDSPNEASRAADLICKAAWSPLYSYARRKGSSPQDAEDAVQSFLSSFTHSGRMAKADKSRGKLRTYLLRAFQNYLSDLWRGKTTLMRGGSNAPLSLDAASAEGYSMEVGFSPEAEFNRNWAQGLLQMALDGLKEKYKALGQAERLEAMLPYLPWFGADHGYAEGASQLGISPQAFKSALFRMRGHYRSLLVEIIKTSLGEDSPSIIDAEINDLHAALVY